MESADTLRPTLLVVDDAPENIELMSELLRDRYRVKIANGGAAALRICRAKPAPDLVLLDIMMPEMDGYEVCRQLKVDPATADIPVIFLTALSAVEDEQKGFRLGAVDYITKPVSPPLLLARVRTHLRLKASADFLRDKNQYLEAEVARRTREVTAIQDVTIQVMASLAETRDNETGNHIRRTQHYVRLLAEQLRYHPRFAPELDDRSIDLLFKSAPLHDIGKVGIPDRILLKAGKLDAEEWAIMKTHARLGAEAIERAEAMLGLDVDFLHIAKQIAASHHEKWDGSGYPAGLAGEAIPLPARLMALADVYDALISRRCYKEPFSHAQAVAIIDEGKGRHFDPEVVEAFHVVEEGFKRIAATYADEH